MFEPGTIIDDVWVVEEVLGAGGMGSVCRCHNRHANRIKAAIKVLSQNLANLPEAQKRFVREAELLFALDHPHIVKVRNVRLDAAPPYIEMEFVEGEPLEAMLREEALSVARALMFAEQLASALRYLHRNEVCHRDIKPANLLVRKGSVLKLVDFGLATEGHGDRITAAGTAFGTVSYAPPEWVRPQDLDAQSWDVYALGVVLYEMLTGEIAFPVPVGAGPRQAALQVMGHKQQLEHLDPGDAFPDELRKLVRDLTARDPADRPPSARQVLRRLQRLQQGLGLNSASLLSEELDPDEFRAQVEASAEVSADSTPAPVRRSGEAATMPPTPSPSPALRDDPSALHDLLSGPVEARDTGSLLGLMALGGGGGLVVLVGLLGLLGLVAGWWYWTRGGDTQLVERPVQVQLDGLPDDLAVTVQVDGRAPLERIDASSFRFAPAEPGPVSLSWSMGEGCDGAGCPGPGCPGWCVTGSRTQLVEPGQGPAVLHLTLEPPAPRQVRVSVPGAGDRDIVARAGDREVGVVDGQAELSLPPGRYELEVTTPECPVSARGCAAVDGCPAGCASVTTTLDVPTVGPARVTLALPDAPAPAPVVRTPRPRPTGAVAGPLVSQRAFSAWLSSHPEWARDTAIASGRADPNYLKGFAADAPGESAVVEVSWSAAAAFCAPRGGLAALSAAPDTWAEDSAPFHEWRVDGDRPAWRRYDGETSYQLARAHSNAFTGFRCASGR